MKFKVLPLFCGFDVWLLFLLRFLDFLFGWLHFSNWILNEICLQFKIFLKEYLYYKFSRIDLKAWSFKKQNSERFVFIIIKRVSQTKSNSSVSIMKIWFTEYRKQAKYATNVHNFWQNLCKPATIVLSVQVKSKSIWNRSKFVHMRISSLMRQQSSAKLIPKKFITFL